MADALERLDLVADHAGLFLGIGGAGDSDLLARLVLGAKRLSQTTLVMGNQVRGGSEDVARRPVIAFESDHPGTREVVLETQDVVHLRSAPAVDRLVVVADATDVLENAGRSLRLARAQALIPHLARQAVILVLRSRMRRLANGEA